MYVCKTPAHRVRAYDKDRTNVFSRIQSPEVTGRSGASKYLSAPLSPSLDGNNTLEKQAFSFQQSESYQIGS